MLAQNLWHLRPARFTINKAMSNSSGIAQFSRECTSEQCSLDAAHAHNYDLIDTITVDDFLKRHEVAHVDILKVGGRQEGVWAPSPGVRAVLGACWVVAGFCACVCVGV